MLENNTEVDHLMNGGSDSKTHTQFLHSYTDWSHLITCLGMWRQTQSSVDVICRIVSSLQTPCINGHATSPENFPNFYQM